ncbi:MAG TPA: hypothetical protein VFE47_13130 [Tepidisphaeraceae bacterium]|jgi:hypothetical protein|nr:hypothetical protein [Tepidisphaeraceae bacterium]
MTSVAAKLLVDFQTLAPDEQLQVLEEVISLTENTRRKAVERLRGASAGKDLLTKLLEDRAGERARG